MLAQMPSRKTPFCEGDIIFTRDTTINPNRASGIINARFGFGNSIQIPPKDSSEYYKTRSNWTLFHENFL